MGFSRALLNGLRAPDGSKLLCEEAAQLAELYAIEDWLAARSIRGCSVSGGEEPLGNIIGFFFAEGVD